MGQTRVTGYPLTIAAWIRPSAIGINTAIAAVGIQAGQSRVQLETAAANTVNMAVVDTGGTKSQAVSSSTIAVGNWYHICGAAVSSTMRRIYFNGSQQNTSTTARTLGTLDAVSVGARYGTGTLSAFASATIAEVGIWNIELSAADVASLAAGARPSKVRPDALQFYFPLLGEASPEVDLINAGGLTLNNTPTNGEHPRIYY